MKRRLTDHDEEALWWLAQVCNRYAFEWHPNTGYVWIRDGWAVASDSYRALVLPVDLDVNGLVASDDALIGGPVEVLRPDPEWEDLWRLVMTYPHRHACSSAVLAGSALDHLARWRRRASVYGATIDDLASDRSTAYLVPKWVAGGRRHELVLPDGTAPLFSFDSASGRSVVTGCAVQAPYLASVAVPLGLVYGDVGVYGITPDPIAALELGPVDPGPAEDGWGLVMPLCLFEHLHPRMLAALDRGRVAS